jgi:myo-inositol-1(or 4)-monophosphatase
MDLHSLLHGARAAVAEAGERIKADFAAPAGIRHKGRIDLVTATDLAVEALLKDRLAALAPEAGFLAEETAGHTRLTGPAWIVDPLDGTTNFAHGFPFVCTSVAYYDGREVALGIVNAPILGQCFTAGRGLGASLNDAPLAVSGVSRLEDALVATGFPYAIREHLDEITADMRLALAATQGIRRPGSAALDLAYVAAGRFDAFYEIGLNPWDVAAGWLLVTEAGGRVTSYRPDGPYHLGASRILASNGALHEPMRALLAENDPAP